MVSKYYKETFGTLVSPDAPSPNAVQSIFLFNDAIILAYHDRGAGISGLTDGMLGLSYQKLEDKHGSPLWFMDTNSAEYSGRSFGNLEYLFVEDTVASTVGTMDLLNHLVSNADNRRLVMASVFNSSELSLGDLGGEEGLIEAIYWATDNKVIPEILLGIGNKVLGYFKSDYLEEVVPNVHLMPEKYPWDAEWGKDYFDSLEFSLGDEVLDEDTDELEDYPAWGQGVSDDDSSEEELGEEIPNLFAESNIAESEESKEHKEEVTELPKHISKYFNIYTKTRITNIINEYDKIFSPGYQLIKPHGVFIPVNAGGRAISIKLKDGVYSSHEEDLNPAILDLGKLLFNRLGIGVGDVSLERDKMRIAELIYNNPDKNYYFANKMLEYAYGMSRELVNDDPTRYKKSNNSKTWGNYRPKVVDDLTKSFDSVTLKYLNNKGISLEGDGYTSESIRKEIVRYYDALVRAYMNVFIIGDLVDADGTIAKVKLRVLDFNGKLDSSKNIVEEAFRLGGNFLNGVSSNMQPISSGMYQTHTFEYNSVLANISPMFAYKAARLLRDQGEDITFNNMVLGVDLNDEVVRNGEVINYLNKLTHLEYAGSRAGKGVSGLAKIVAAIKSGKPLFYFDNKPDMGDLILELCREAFVIQGGGIVDPGGGTHEFGNFTEGSPSIYINPQNVPSYIYGSGGLVTDLNWKQLGGLFYARGLLFVMALIAARATNIRVNELGGDTGLTVFFDEFNQFHVHLANIWENIANNIAPTKEYRTRLRDREAWQEYEEALASAEGKRKPKKPESKANPSVTALSYWNWYFQKSLAKSTRYMVGLRNAAGQNIESKITDVFVVGQALPTPYSQSDAASGFVREPAATVLTATKTNKENEDVITSNKEARTFLPLVAPWGSDVILGNAVEFVGSDQAKGGPLGISSSSKPEDWTSYAAKLVNPNTRRFAYVPDYESTYSRLVNDREYAKTVFYYKPLLTISTHAKNQNEGKSYFLSTLLGNVAKTASGDATTDPEFARSVIEDNSFDVDGNRQMASDTFYEVSGTSGINSEYQITEAISLKGYLHDLGLTDEDIYVSLKKSSDIANNFTSMLGYQGTWHDLITDLRPEWTFDLELMLNAVRDGVPLNELNKKQHTEMIELFPEEYGSSLGSVGGKEDEYYSGDEQVGSLFTKTSEVNGVSSEEVGTGGSPFTTLANSGNLYEDENGNLIDNATGKVVNNGIDFMVDDENASSVYINDGTFSGIDVNAGMGQAYVPNDAQSQFTAILNDTSLELNERQYQAINSKLQQFLNQNSNLRDPEVEIVLGNFTSLEGELQEIDSLYDDARTKGDVEAVDQLGREAFSSRGINEEAYNNRETTFSYEDLVTKVHNSAKDLVRFYGGYRSIVVQGGAFFVNGTCTKLKGYFTREYFKGMPISMAEDIYQGRLADFVLWQNYTGSDSPFSISIDSQDYFRNKFCSDLNITGDPNLTYIFRLFPKLQELSIAGKVYTRDFVEGRPVTTIPEDERTLANTRLYRISDEFLTKNLKHAAKTSWKTLFRKDIGLGRKVATAGFYTADTVVTGAGVAAVRGTGFVAKHAKNLFNMIKDPESFVTVGNYDQRRGNIRPTNDDE